MASQHVYELAHEERAQPYQDVRMERAPSLRLDLAAEGLHGPKDPRGGRGHRYAAGAPVPRAPFLGRNASPAASHALGVDAEDVDRKDVKKVVLSDRTGDGKVGKHAVKMRVRENVKYYICNFCPR